MNNKLVVLDNLELKEIKTTNMVKTLENLKSYRKGFSITRKQPKCTNVSKKHRRCKNINSKHNKCL